ncbi:hypothetical protein [Ottowia thiooxydans]|uniref:hypothetical protein n=1 Tax=Ottowia thiooxydans TaxID=219182 RepID=UPI0012EC01D9|nr:hypothetical protein [Ottowia thiooxydans]
MKNKFTCGSVLVYALALTACGGDGGNTPPTNVIRADEGIWTTYLDPNPDGHNMMQAIILNDGSYFGISGRAAPNNMSFCPEAVSYGKANANGNTVSGTYAEASGIYAETSTFRTGAYSGTAFTKENISLTFESTGLSGAPEKRNFSLSYDSIYDRPASLSEIEGGYNQAIFDCGGTGFGNPGVPVDPEKPPIPTVLLNPLISGTSLNLVDKNVGAVMTGTVAPHGTAVNVFDLKLTTTVPVWSFGYFNSGGVIGLKGAALPAGTVFKGVLFTTSFGVLKNKIQIFLTSGNTFYSYMGTKKID